MIGRRTTIGSLSLALVAIATIGVATVWASPLQFTANPSVSNIQTDRATVSWATDIPADSTVWYTANPPGWQSQNPNVSGTMHTYDIGGVPGTFEQWAIGFGGKITHTLNGSTWSEQTSGTAESLYAINALANGQAWIVGNQGTILFYNGTSWSPQTSGVTTALMSVKAFATNNVWAVGYNGTIIHYNGASWSTVTSPTTDILLGVDGAAANNIWAVGYNGRIIHFDGATWQNSTSPTSQRLAAITVPTSSVAWAVGDNGVLIKYNGSTWSLVNANTTRNLLDIDSFDAANAWASGENGTLTSTSDGNSWNSMTLGANSLEGVSIGDSVNIWAGGLTNSLYHYGINFTNSVYNSEPSNSSILLPLTPNTTYYYIVEASHLGETIVSPLGSFRTLVVDVTPPPAPTLSGTTDCTTGGMFFNNLNWTAVTDPAPDASGISGYTLVVGATPLITNQPVTNYSHSSLTEGTAYSYTVRAHDNAGNNSPTSNVVSLTTRTKDFSLTNATGNQTVRAGDPATYNLTLASLCGLSESVSLSVAGLPAGTTPSFAPNNFIPAAGGTPDTLSITTLRTVTPGTYPITITATSASKTHSVTANLIITPPADYTVSVSPPSRTVTAGGPAVTYTTTVTPLNGFADTVNFSISGLPSGANGSFSPASVAVSGTPVTSQLTVTTTAATPAGTYTLTITGDDVGGIGPKTATTQLIVNPAPDFTLSVTPNTQTTPAGDPVNYVISLTSLNGLTGNATVTMTTGTAPTNTTYSPTLLTTPTNVFVPANGTGSITLVITPAQNASNGTFTYTVGAQLGGVNKSTNFTLVIGQAKDFTITVNPTPLTVSQGGTGTATVTIATTNGLDGNVALTLAGMPASSSSSWSANPVNPSGTSINTTLTISANTANEGTYPVTITGTYGAVTHSTVLTLIIVDTAAPVISFISVTPGVTDADIAWITNEAANSGIYYWETATPANTSYQESAALVTNHTMTLTGLTALTNYTFQIIAIDAAGNQGTDIERTFTTLAAPDTIDPVVSLTTPTQQTPAIVLSGTTSIQGSATDNTGVTNVALKIRTSTGTVTAIVPSPNYDPSTGAFSLNWDTMAITNGAYTLFAEASDAAGNLGVSNLVSIEIYNDTTAPVVENITTSTTNTTAIIEWDTFGDASTSVIDYGLENADGTYSYTNQVSTDDSGQQYVEHHTVTLSNLTPFRRYHFQISSCDTTGNCGH